LQLMILPLVTLSLLSAVNVNIKRVSAVESPYIAVVPESIVNQTLIPGENFTVSIYTNYGENVATEWDVTAYQFHLFYDPYVLNCIKATNGEVIVGGKSTFLAGPFDNEAGELSLTVGFYDSEGEVTSMFRPEPWNGTLANVTFTVVGKGTSTVTIGPHTTLFGWNFTAGEEYTIIEAETMPTQIQHGYFDNRFSHDVAVGSLTAQAEAPVGSLVPIGVEVANIGKSTEVANVTICYDSVYIDSQNVALLVGENRTVSFSWNTTDVALGIYTINATATIVDDGDPNDNWNTTTILFVAHDVAVGSVTAPAKSPVGSVVGVNVGVANEGAFDEEANVTISYDTTHVGSQNVTLAKGENKTTLFSWNTTDVAQGIYTINATATIVDDGDPNDNWNTTTIIIVEHDMTVKNVLVTPDKATPGDIVSINVTVANIGASAEVANVTICYDSVYIDSQNVALLVGENRTVSFSWNTTDVAQGIYTINATATIVDDGDPNDNWNTTTILLAMHDVAVKRISAPTSVDVGELVTVRVQVENLGGYNETFDVEVTYDTSTIEEPYSATMLPWTSEYIDFNWNTTGVTPDSYTLTARAVLDGDINPANNLETKSIIVELPLGTIVGNVTDASTGLPIAGATVTAGDYTNISDANGYYVMSGVTPGNYTVTASATGYESASQHNRVVISGETVTVNFALRVNSVITLSVDPTTITVGESITVSGSIDPIRENVTVTIWHRTGQGTWITLTTVTTDENSQYSHVWTVDTIGTYEVKASWLGDENTAPAESNVQTITVEEAPSGIPWELYVAAAGVTAVIIAAIAFYFLKIRRPKPT